jgi:hypothetical protein
LGHNSFVVVLCRSPAIDPASVVLPAGAHAALPQVASGVDIDGKIPVAAKPGAEQVDALDDDQTVRIHLDPVSQSVGGPVVPLETRPAPGPEEPKELVLEAVMVEVPLVPLLGCPSRPVSRLRAVEVVAVHDRHVRSLTGDRLGES